MRAPPGLLARLPVRARLTLAFTGVMAVLLAAAGIALSVLVAHNLDSTIDDGLAARAGDAAAFVRTSGGLARTGEAYAQVLTPAGRLLETTPGAGDQPLISPAEAARADRQVVIADRNDRNGAALRVYARPARARGADVIVVVGESLLQREHALDALHALLAV